MALQERRRVALKLVNVTDAYFGTMTSRGWFFGLFREVCPALTSTLMCFEPLQATKQEI